MGFLDGRHRLLGKLAEVKIKIKLSRSQRAGITTGFWNPSRTIILFFTGTCCWTGGEARTAAGAREDIICHS